MNKNGRILLIMGAVALLLLIGAAYGSFVIYQSGFWQGPDAKFGDQHLKTSVALIELHKTRFGRYPKSLRDLKYLGDWDPIHVQAVKYRANDDGSKYCVVVVQGWIGKPDLKMSDDFWQGTDMTSHFANSPPSFSRLDMKR